MSVSTNSFTPIAPRCILVFLGWTYVDGSEAGTVPGSHVLVKSLDGLGAGHLAVLLVHVVGTGAGVVADPDAEVLDLERVLLVDLWSRHVSFHRLDPGLLIMPSSSTAPYSASFSSLGRGMPHTTFRLTISPVAFLTFFRPRMKYQYRDLATTGLGAKIRMRYRAGVGLASVGKCRPITWYS